MRRLPVVRGDCVGGHRPCPLVSCKYHLAVVGVAGGGRRAIQWNRGGVVPPGEPETWSDDAVVAYLATLDETCVLDVADAVDGGLLPHSALGELLGVTKQHAQQEEARALERAQAMWRFHGWQE